MINNTSVQKWDRLAQKQLDQQLMNEIVHGLQCSPFEPIAFLKLGAGARSINWVFKA